jgi:hypothetical protein
VRSGVIVIFAVLTLFASFSSAAETTAQDQTDAEVPVPPEWTPGLVFTTDSILLNITSFNGGIGGVLRADDVAIRATVGAITSNSFRTLAFRLGGWYVRYFWTGRVAPYWNAFARTELLSQTNEADRENWVRDFSFEVAGGASLGAELFVMDVVSVFAEYSLSVGAAGQRTTTSVGGTVTPGDYDWTFSAGTDLAHGGALGVILYFAGQAEIGGPE